MKRLVVLLLFNVGCTKQCAEEWQAARAEQLRYEASCTEPAGWTVEYDFVFDMPMPRACYRCEDGKELCR